MKNSILFRALQGGANLVVFLIFSVFNTVSSQNLHTIEIAVSWDQTLDQKFATAEPGVTAEEYALSYFGGVFQEYLNNSLRPLLQTTFKTYSFQIKLVKRVAITFPSGLTGINGGISNYWNRIESCDEYDMIHHFTADLAGPDGHFSASGLCENNYQSYLSGRGTVTVSEYNPDNVLESFGNFIHELGHGLGMAHENSNCATNFMCDMGANNVQMVSQFTLSEANKASARNKLNNAPCTLVTNTGNAPEGCTDCNQKVKINSLPNGNINIQSNCEESVFGTKKSITSFIENSCYEDRTLMAEILYNSNQIEIIDLEDGWTGPFSVSLPEFDAKYMKVSEALPKNGGRSSTFVCKILNNNIPGPNHGSKVLVKYTVNPAPTNFPNGIQSSSHYFKYNYQMDKRGISPLFATDVKINFIDNYGFCESNSTFDIYIDGLFYIDKNQSYCNTNFFFGPDAKVVVNSGKTLTLTNCKLTTCGEGEKWQGIELEAGANIVLDKTTLEKAKTGVLSEFATSSISVKNKSIIHSCGTGLRVVTSSLFPLENSTFSNNSTAIFLTNCPLVNANKCTFSMNNLGINALNTNVLSTSDFSGSSTARGIQHNASGANELFVPEGKFNNLGQGIISNNARLIVGNSIALKPEFKLNQIGIFKGSSPLLVNTIKSSKFDENEYGILISQSNSQGNLSYINGQCEFTNNKYGVSVTNSLGKGWWINDNTFDVPFVGIKTSKSDKVDIDNNTFTALPNSRFGSAKDMVIIEGGRDNKVHENTMTHLSNSSESAQMRNIYVANANSTQVHCNILNNGTYGLNVWGAAPSTISANTIKGSHTGMYYGLFPSNGNVVTGVQAHHGNVWEKNPPFLSSFGAKHLGTIPLNVNESRFIVDENENPKFNTNFSAVTNWITNQNDPANSSNCANPPLSGSSGNAGGNTGTGSGNGSGSGSTMALSISNGDVPFADYSVPLNQALDQQLYTSLLNSDNSGLNTNQINTYTSTMSNTLGGTLAQATYLMSQPVTGSSQISTNSDQLHTLMEAYYTLETNNDPNAATIRSQINTLSATLSTAYQTYQTNLYNRIDQVHMNLAPLLTSSDPYIFAQANVMHLNLKQLKGDSLNLEDINKLTQIANSCPLAYGDAVYGARGMLSSLTFTDPVYDDHQLCQQSTPRSIQKTGSSHSIYPNPTYSVINVSNTMKVSQATLLDNTDRLILNVNNLDGVSELSINVENVPAGVYYLKLDNFDKTYTIHKIIVIK